MRLSIVLALLLTFAFAPATIAESPKDGPMWVFIGTYTGGKKSEGIYRVPFDPATGKLGTPELAAKATNPSFLAIHPNRTHLFAVGEVGDAKGKRGGGVMSYK